MCIDCTKWGKQGELHGFVQISMRDFMASVAIFTGSWLQIDKD